ncbi:caspase family protein [Flindersiella endophytica]
MTRRALFVSTSTYADGQLAQLPSAARDAVELGGLFADPRVGPFTVDTLESPSAQEMRLALEDLFADSMPGDLVLLYLSGHGLKDVQGNLYFAAHDTRPNRLQSTAVAAQFLCSLLNSSRAEGAVVFLDCCYGGAFARGMVARAAGDPQVGDAFVSLGSGARARAVITASSAIEYAFEGERLTDTHVQPSVFASAMRDAITDGHADRDGDGWVGLNELFDHIRQHIARAGQPQTPHIWTFGSSGELHITRNPRGARAVVTVLPPEIRELLASPVPAARLGAATDLRHRATSDDLPMARAAVAALVELTEDDSLRVRAAADLGLKACQPRVSPAQLAASPGTTARATLSGSAIGMEAFVEAAPDGLTASVDNGELVVTVGDDVPSGDLELQLRWTGGTLPVRVEVEAPPAAPEPPAAEPEEPEVLPTPVRVEAPAATRRAAEPGEPAGATAPAPRAPASAAGPEAPAAGSEEAVEGLASGPVVAGSGEPGDDAGSERSQATVAEPEAPAAGSEVAFEGLASEPVAAESEEPDDVAGSERSQATVAEAAPAAAEIEEPGDSPLSERVEAMMAAAGRAPGRAASEPPKPVEAGERARPSGPRRDQPLWLLAAAVLWLVALFLPIESSGGSAGSGGGRIVEMAADTPLSELPGFLLVLAFLIGALTLAGAGLRSRRLLAGYAAAVCALLHLVITAITAGVLLAGGDFYLAGIAITLAFACTLIYVINAVVRNNRIARSQGPGAGL